MTLTEVVAAPGPIPAPATAELDPDGAGLPEEWGLLIDWVEPGEWWYERKPFAIEVRWEIPKKGVLEREYRVDGAVLLDGQGREAERFELGPVTLHPGDTVTLVYEPRVW